MQEDCSVRLSFVFSSLEGWPFSREYHLDLWSLMLWIQCWIKAVLLGRATGGEGGNLFWGGSLFNPITVSERADWTTTSKVMCLPWKPKQQRCYMKCDVGRVTVGCLHAEIRRKQLTLCGGFLLMLHEEQQASWGWHTKVFLGQPFCDLGCYQTMWCTFHLPNVPWAQLIVTSLAGWISSTYSSIWK